MKTLSIIVAAALAVSSTAATAGNVLDAGTDAVIVPVPEIAAGSSLGSLGSGAGTIILGVVGVALLAAALDSGSSSSATPAGS